MFCGKIIAVLAILAPKCIHVAWDGVATDLSVNLFSTFSNFQAVYYFFENCNTIIPVRKSRLLTYEITESQKTKFILYKITVKLFTGIEEV